MFITGNFDPKAMNNFYDNIGLTGPVGAVPPKHSKKGKLLTDSHVLVSAGFFRINVKVYFNT